MNNTLTPFFKGELKAFFLILLFVTFSAAQAAPPLWTQARELSLGAGVSSEVDTCSRGDEVYVVWSDDRTGNRDIFFASSPDAGQTWTKEERLTDTRDDSSQPAIAYDSRNLHIVWREKTEDSSRIYYKRWDGEAWSDSRLLSDGHQNARNPDIASTTLFPESILYAVWEDDKDGKTTVYLTRSTNAGRDFSEPQPITSGEWSTREPAIWGGARDAYLVWADGREGSWNVFFRRWGEVQQGQEVKLSPLADCRSPSIGGLEPGICVAWQCVEKGTLYADVYSSLSENHGADWSAVQRLTDGEAESVFPKAIVSESETSGDDLAEHSWVFWQDGRTGEWQIIFQTLNTEEQYLTESDKPAIMPDVVFTPGQIHAFWTHVESGSRSKIMYMRRDTVPPAPPGTPSHFDLTAVPGYDDDNQITFTWKSSESREPVKYKVYSRVDDGKFTLIGNTESTTYNVNGESGRTYQIYVEAADAVGNVSAASGISTRVMCDPDPPVVTIHSPNPNSTIRGDTPIIITVHDSNLLDYVIEYGITAVPSEWIILAGPFQEEVDRTRAVTWQTDDLEGIYAIRIRVQDKAGNRSRAEAIVNIDSRPPSVISPGAGTYLTDPGAIWSYGSPSWSPAGDKIAFHSDEGGTEDIWVMSPVTHLSSLITYPSRTRLTWSNIIEHNPRWSPSGDMIAFQAFTEDNLWDIRVMRSDGTDARQVISGPGSDMNPTWSPDGTFLAFDSDRDGDGEIYLVDVSQVLAGNEPQLIQLTDNVWEDRQPDWSPDGSRIVFQSSRRGNWDLYVVGIDGSSLDAITATPADEIEPACSPDRKRILFSTNEPGDHYEIHAINWPDVSGQVRLSPEGWDARNGRWSPAMDSIAFEHEGGLHLIELVYPVGQLAALISWPRDGEVLTGSVDVRGIAYGSGFQSYSLQYASLDGSRVPLSDFYTIGGESTSPVTETGFLGRWHTQELEGEYLLRLSVTGKDGGIVEHSVQVLVVNQLPFLLINEPKNGLITDKQIINVIGRTGQRVMLTINNSDVYLEPDGSFSWQVQLSEGENTITAKARNPLGQSGEYVVERKVVLDTRAPGINIESPEDFQVIHVPYVTVKGSVDEDAEVSILSKRVWPDNNRRFQRTIVCSEGTNLISVVAFDELGHYNSVARRVIFRRETESRADISPPVITDLFPDERAIVTGKNVEISATLVDDVGIDPLSIAFSFDGEELPAEEYELDVALPDETEGFPLDKYPIIHLKYRLPLPVAEGLHSFEITLQDASNNSGGSAFHFTVETSPPEAIVSAILASPNQVTVIATVNRTLSKINTCTVQVPTTQSAYSLSMFEQNDHYETTLSITPSQRNFIVDFAAKTHTGKSVNAYGYMAWGTARSGESIYLGVQGSPQFSSDRVDTRENEFALILRSQDGLDLELLERQRSDAEYRKLKPSGLTYILSASEEFEAEKLDGGVLTLVGILSLPVLNTGDSRLVMFRWDDDIGKWRPLDKLSSVYDSVEHAASLLAVESRIGGPGIYTLLEDVDPPVIKDVSPMNTAEVPLDRFFVEASISDVGSGISDIKLFVDDRDVAYEYNPEQEQLIYFPSSLEWGFHRMEVIATDRAGNISESAMSFITKDVFQFIRVRAYPNPAYGDVNIEFRLTRAAEVELRIYTLAGELVYTSSKQNTANGKFTWARKNSAGNRIASGIYIYSIEATLYDMEIHKQGTIAVVM